MFVSRSRPWAARPAAMFAERTGAENIVIDPKSCAATARESDDLGRSNAATRPGQPAATSTIHNAASMAALAFRLPAFPCSVVPPARSPAAAASRATGSCRGIRNGRLQRRIFRALPALPGTPRGAISTAAWDDGGPEKRHSRASCIRTMDPTRFHRFRESGRLVADGSHGLLGRRGPVGRLHVLRSGSFRSPEAWARFANFLSQIASPGRKRP